MAGQNKFNFGRYFSQIDLQVVGYQSKKYLKKTKKNSFGNLLKVHGWCSFDISNNHKKLRTMPTLLITPAKGTEKDKFDDFAFNSFFYYTRHPKPISGSLDITIEIEKGLRPVIKKEFNDAGIDVTIKRIDQDETETTVKTVKPAKVTEPKTPKFANVIPEFTIAMKYKQKASELKLITCSKDCADVCREVFDADTMEWTESFIVIGLSRSNKVLGWNKISQGGITGTVADPRVIMQFALLSNSSSLILCHNHPSGNLTPSRQDEQLTEKVRHAAHFLDIKVLDHIIITAESYYSFADNGLL